MERETLTAHAGTTPVARATIQPYVDGAPGRSSTSATPTRSALEAERLLGELEGGPRCCSRPGWAPPPLVLAMLKPGATVAVADGGYYGTVGLLRGELARWGLEVDRLRPDRPAAARRPGVARAVLEPDADLPGSRRVDRRRARGGRAGRRRQHRAQPAAAAPARARRRLRPALRHEDPRRPPRRAARGGRLRARRGRRATARVARPRRDRRRARPGLAAAARAEDARRAGPAPVGDRARAGAPAARPPRGRRRVRYPGLGPTRSPPATPTRSARSCRSTSPTRPPPTASSGRWR